jgi:hypothetical protein
MCSSLIFLIFHLPFDGALVGGYKICGGMCFELPIDEVKSCHELRPRSLACPESMKKNTDKEGKVIGRSLHQS